MKYSIAQAFKFTMALAALTVVSSALAAETVHSVAPPAGFDEGTQTELSEEQMRRILPWATNSEVILKDLRDATSELPAHIAKDRLIEGIRSAVLFDAPKQSEILMRYVLNRALKVVDQIEQDSNSSSAGIVDQQVRILRLSLDMALAYIPRDVAFLNGRVLKREVAPPSFAEFGIRYAQFLMSIDHSLWDASAQYNVAAIALGLLQWDLWRDADQAAYGPAITKIQTTLKLISLKVVDDSPRSIALLRQLKQGYKRAIEMASSALADIRQTRQEALERSRMTPEEIQKMEELRAQRLEQERNMREWMSSRQVRNKNDLARMTGICASISGNESSVKCYYTALTGAEDFGATLIAFACRTVSSWADARDCVTYGTRGLLAGESVFNVMTQACGNLSDAGTDSCTVAAFRHLKSLSTETTLHACSATGTYTYAAACYRAAYPMLSGNLTAIVKRACGVISYSQPAYKCFLEGATTINSAETIRIKALCEKTTNFGDGHACFLKAFETL